MNQKFIKFMNEFSGQKLAVAVSGGVDSVCLLCWLADMGLHPIALHVNHGLRDVAGPRPNMSKTCAPRAELNATCLNGWGTSPPQDWRPPPDRPDMK